jgi:hypothetical protein
MTHLKMAVKPKHIVWYYIVYSKDEISCEQRQLTCDFVKHRRNRMHQTKIKIVACYFRDAQCSHVGNC